MAKGDIRDLDRITDNTSRVPIITPEMQDRMRRVVCGANSVKGPEDASTILQALGLVPYPEVNDAEVSGDGNS